MSRVVNKANKVDPLYILPRRSDLNKYFIIYFVYLLCFYLRNGMKSHFSDKNTTIPNAERSSARLNFYLTPYRTATILQPCNSTDFYTQQQAIITDLPFGGGERLLLCVQHKSKNKHPIHQGQQR